MDGQQQSQEQGAPSAAENAVNALFGARAEGNAPSGTNAREEGAQGAQPPQSGPAPGADGKIPPQFLNQDGSTNQEALLKSWVDTQADRTRLSQRVSEFEKAGREAVPEQYAAYREGFDLDALKEAAPKAAPADATQEQAFEALLQSLHAQGVPMKAAHAAVADWYGKVDGMLPEPMSREDAMKAAIDALPNGDVVATDVQTWLAAKARANAFDEGQLEVIGAMLTNPSGLSLLQRLSRENTTGAPPSVDRRFLGADDGQRKADVKSKLGLDDAAWKAQKEAILGEYEKVANGKALFPDALIQ